MPQDVFSLIPKQITAYRDLKHFSEGGVPAPVNPTRQYKPWRDANAMPRQVHGWPQFSRPASGGSYSFIVRNPDGTPKLAPVDSAEFLATYTSLSVVNTYREYAFLFSAGVPVVATGAVHADDWNINFAQGAGSIDYPVEIPSNVMLIADASAPGGVAVWDYQEWLKSAKPQPMSPTETLDAIAMMVDTARAGAVTAEHALQAIRIMTTNYTVPMRLV